MTNEDYAALGKWQGSINGQCERSIYSIQDELSRVKDMAETRVGAVMIRNNVDRLKEIQSTVREVLELVGSQW